MSTETNDTTWIGVKEIAAEMNWTDRQAYEEVRRLGVPCRGRGRMGLRFRQTDYEQRRDAALAPLEAHWPTSTDATGSRSGFAETRSEAERVAATIKAKDADVTQPYDR